MTHKHRVEVKTYYLFLEEIIVFSVLIFIQFPILTLCYFFLVQWSDVSAIKSMVTIFFNLSELIYKCHAKIFLYLDFWSLSFICLYVAYSAWLFMISKAFVALFGYELTVVLCHLHIFFIFLQTAIPRRFSQNYGAIHCHNKNKLFIFYSSLYIPDFDSIWQFYIGPKYAFPIKGEFWTSDLKHFCATLAQENNSMKSTGFIKFDNCS